MKIGGHLEVAAADVGVEHTELERLDLGGDADLLPLVGQPHGEGRVRVGNAPVLEGEGEALRHPRLTEETARLRPSLADVTPIPGQALQLRAGGGERSTWSLHPRHLLEDRDLREGLRALPAIQSEGEGPPDASVVEGLALVIYGERVDAFPGALLHGDLRPERRHQGVPLRG